MKLFTKSILAMMAMVAAVGFTACSDDDYEPGAQSNGAYFALTNPTEVEVNLTTTSFDVEVLRNDATKAESYKVSVFDESGAAIDGLTIPKEAVFAEGQKSTNVEITIDIAKIAQDKEYKLKLVLDNANQYGRSVYEMTLLRTMPTVTVPMPPKGRATYTYNKLVVGTDGYYPVTKTYNPEDPDHNVIITLQQWGYDIFSADGVDMQVVIPDMTDVSEDGTIPVYMPGIFTGRINGDEAHTPIWVGSAQWWISVEAQRPDLTNNYPESYYDPATGTFVLNLVYYPYNKPGYRYGDPAEEIIQLDGFPVYDVTVDFAGFSISPDGDYSVNVILNAGADVAVTRIGYMQSYNIDEVLAATLAGTCPKVEVEGPAEDAVVSLPFSDMGDYTAVAVSYSADGEAQSAAYCQFTADFGSGDKLADWEDAGMCHITDGWIIPFAELKDGSIAQAVDFQYDVPLMKHKTDKNHFMMIQPWGPDHPLAHLNSSPSAKRNVEFYLVDNKYTFLLPQQTGFSLDADMVSVMNLEGFYRAAPANDKLTDAEIGAICAQNYATEATIYEDGVFTIQNPLYSLSTEDGVFQRNPNYRQAAVIQISEDEVAATAAKKARAARVAAPKFRGISKDAVNGQVQRRMLPMFEQKADLTKDYSNCGLRSKLNK